MGKVTFYRIALNTWNEYMVYRMNFIFWRVRVIVRFLITFFLWSSIFSQDIDLLGYNRRTMLTYLLLVYLLGNFVYATRTQDIGDEIHEGNLTNYLLKPLNYFLFILARDTSDKLLNLSFTLVELIMLFTLLNPPFFWQTDMMFVSISFLAFCGSVIIYFLLSSLLGLLGFWTSEVWATRFIFIIILDFLAGNFFPTDILPKLIANVLMYTPFPYMFYFPARIYLGEVTEGFIAQGFFVMGVWVFFLIFAVHVVWYQGLKVYGAQGR